MKMELPKKLTWDEGVIGGIDVEGNIYLVAELIVKEDEPLAQEIVKRWNEHEQLQAVLRHCINTFNSVSEATTFMTNEAKGYIEQALKGGD